MAVAEMDRKIDILGPITRAIPEAAEWCGDPKLNNPGTLTLAYGLAIYESLHPLVDPSTVPDPALVMIQGGEMTNPHIAIDNVGDPILHQLCEIMHVPLQDIYSEEQQDWMHRKVLSPTGKKYAGGIDPFDGSSLYMKWVLERNKNPLTPAPPNTVVQASGFTVYEENSWKQVASVAVDLNANFLAFGMQGDRDRSGLFVIENGKLRKIPMFQEQPDYAIAQLPRHAESREAILHQFAPEDIRDTFGGHGLTEVMRGKIALGMIDTVASTRSGQPGYEICNWAACAELCGLAVKVLNLVTENGSDHYEPTSVGQIMKAGIKNTDLMHKRYAAYIARDPEILTDLLKKLPAGSLSTSHIVYQSHPLAA